MQLNLLDRLAAPFRALLYSISFANLVLYSFLLSAIRGVSSLKSKASPSCKTATAPLNRQRREELLQERARLEQEHAHLMQMRAQVDGAIKDTLTNEKTARYVNVENRMWLCPLGPLSLAPPTFPRVLVGMMRLGILFFLFSQGQRRVLRVWSLSDI